MPIKFFRPARTVKGKRWYIVFYQTHPDTGKLERHRESFDLMRIKSVRERQRMANYWCQHVNQRLPLGYPHQQRIREKTQQYTLAKGIAIAKQVRMDSDRRNTVKTVRTVANAFEAWMQEKQLADLPLADFTPMLAQEWLDWLRQPQALGTTNRRRNAKRMANTTYNNYLTKIKSLFNVLVDRELIHRSPFEKFKKRKEEPKRRRPLSVEEITQLMSWMKTHDPDLLAVCLHLYVMMIRPVELRRMKVCDVNYQGGVVVVTKANAKMKRDRIATVPESLRQLLQQRVAGASGSDYLFGKKLAATPTPCSINSMYNRHRKALEACGIDYESGASLYSWKDAGITHMAEALGTFHAQTQAGHTSATITERYIHRPKLDEKVAKMQVPGLR